MVSQKSDQEQEYGQPGIPALPVIIDSVASIAQFTEGRLQPGDQLVSINDQPFQFYDEFDRLKKQYKGSVVTVKALRE
jgi:PDZ domain-containing secreted protein